MSAFGRRPLGAHAAGPRRPRPRSARDARARRRAAPSGWFGEGLVAVGGRDQRAWPRWPRPSRGSSGSAAAPRWPRRSPERPTPGRTQPASDLGRLTTAVADRRRPRAFCARRARTSRLRRPRLPGLERERVDRELLGHLVAEEVGRHRRSGPARRPPSARGRAERRRSPTTTVGSFAQEALAEATNAFAAVLRDGGRPPIFSSAAAAFARTPSSSSVSCRREERGDGERRRGCHRGPPRRYRATRGLSLFEHRDQRRRRARTQAVEGEHRVHHHVRVRPRQVGVRGTERRARRRRRAGRRASRRLSRLSSLTAVSTSSWISSGSIRVCVGDRARLVEQVLHQPLVLTLLGEHAKQDLLVRVPEDGVDLVVAGIAGDVRRAASRARPRSVRPRSHRAQR